MKIKALQEAGATMGELWAFVNKELEKFRGGLEDDSTLAVASMGALKEAWEDFKTKLGTEFLGTAAGAVDDLTAAIERLANSPEFQKAIRNLGTFAEILMFVVKRRWEVDA